MRFLPAGQRWQAAKAVVLANRPTEHRVQALAPCSALCVPFGHGEHAPSSAVEPSLPSICADSESNSKPGPHVEFVIFLQPVVAASVFSEYMPVGHQSHASLPLFTKSEDVFPLAHV